jgi:hypothetical protein
VVKPRLVRSARSAEVGRIATRGFLFAVGQPRLEPHSPIQHERSDRQSTSTQCSHLCQIVSAEAVEGAYHDHTRTTKLGEVADGPLR